MPRITVAERVAAMLGWLAADGRLDVVDAATRLSVAQETIRRDLRTLEAEGKLQRVHGGAVPIPAQTFPTLPATSPGDESDLDVTAQLWKELPRTGSILLGVGRLSGVLAQTIIADPPQERGLTIVTNSLDAAVLLSRARTLSVYNIGGTVSPDTRAQEGDWALRELDRLTVDVAVVCPDGISVEHGLSHATPAAAAVSQAEVCSGAKVIALVEAAAVGRSSFVKFADVGEIDAITVAGDISPEACRPFSDRGLTVSVAPRPASPIAR